MRKAAVAIIVSGNDVLMGLATSPDFRYGKWCFIGGGIEIGETPLEAAERESHEEAGVIVKARPGEAYIVDERPHIIYVICDYVSGALNPNDEFSKLDWVPINSIPPELDVLELNRKIIEKLLKQ